MLALNIAAMPIIIKFNGITFALNKVLTQRAVNKPKKAPIKRLGAKTPPSPPEESVMDVIIGFMTNIAKIVSTNGKVKASVFAEMMLCFMA
ncbi:hypothetical protein D3C80_1387390 [compost metagenome]